MLPCLHFQELQDFDCQANQLLANTFKFKESGGLNIDLQDKLDFFKRAFNREKAMKEGKIIPKKGTTRTIHIEGKLDIYLAQKTGNQALLLLEDA